ncbi:DUF2889 domain-containing protein [Variovorax ureilyticus]|uniref:DUF2889 domain-containing protein n=1 Tax=Variovorax ureilyticus TaxID=1836198 RepID=A0ABU8V9V2_9BURK
MPLPPPTAERDPVHGRTITLRGYRRSDGLWDVEGHLCDVRDQHFVFPGGERPGGEAIHSMRLRLTVDSTALIVDAVASTDAAPFPNACGDIAPDYARLIGLRVGPGFSRQTARLFGGVRGCTHMSELLRTMGTGVLQTLAGTRLGVSETEKPLQLDGCHALATDGPRVAAFYPRWYRPKREEAEASDPS